MTRLDSTAAASPERRFPPARPEVEHLKAYSAPLEGRRNLLRLDFNENTVGPSPRVVEALRAMDEVDYVVLTAGSFDILVEVVCADDDHLLDLLNRHIRTIPGVRGLESFVYLKLAKQTYQWGTR